MNTFQFWWLIFVVYIFGFVITFRITFDEFTTEEICAYSFLWPLHVIIFLIKFFKLSLKLVWKNIIK
jgi:hypothetical protein